MKSDGKRKGFVAKLSNLLKQISFGKIQTKLYYNGKSSKGSVATGILTIFLTLSLVGYAVFLFWDIIDRQNYSLDLTLMDISCLKAVGGNNTADSILTDQIYMKNSSDHDQNNQVEITIGEYANVLKNHVYYIYSDNITY